MTTRETMRYRRAFDAVADLVLLVDDGASSDLTLHGITAGAALQEWAELMAYEVVSERLDRIEDGQTRTWTVLRGIIDGRSAITVHLPCENLEAA